MCVGGGGVVAQMYMCEFVVIMAINIIVVFSDGIYRGSHKCDCTKQEIHAC